MPATPTKRFVVAATPAADSAYARSAMPVRLPRHHRARVRARLAEALLRRSHCTSTRASAVAPRAARRHDGIEGCCATAGSTVQGRSRTARGCGARSMPSAACGDAARAQSRRSAKRDSSQRSCPRSSRPLTGCPTASDLEGAASVGAGAGDWVNTTPDPAPTKRRASGYLSVLSCCVQSSMRPLAAPLLGLPERRRPSGRCARCSCRRGFRRASAARHVLGGGDRFVEAAEVGQRHRQAFHTSAKRGRSPAPPCTPSPPTRGRRRRRNRRRGRRARPAVAVRATVANAWRSGKR